MLNLLAILFVALTVASVVECDGSNSDNMVQICGSSENLDCIKKYFSKNSHCKVQNRAENYVFVKENLDINVPAIDLKVVTVNTNLSRFDKAVLKHVSMDKERGNILVEVDFTKEGIFCNAPNSFFAISQEKLEPQTLVVDVSVDYKVTITALIPLMDGDVNADSMINATCYGYYPSTDIPINIGPQFTQSSVPVIQKSFQGLIEKKATCLKEIAASKMHYLFLAWFENYVCDFGVMPVIQNYDTTILKSLVGVNVDDRSKFSMPCSQSDDMLKCVRDYFEKHSSGKIIRDSDTGPVERDSYVLQVPVCNSSIEVPHAKVSNVNGKIKAFYMDEQTNNLVMSVGFQDVHVSAESFTLVTYVEGAEPKKTMTSISVDYDTVLTAVINLDNGLNLKAMENAFISPYFPEPPHMKLGSDLEDSQDPQIRKVAEIMKNDKLTFTKEIFVREGSMLFKEYMRTHVVDF